MIGFRLFAAALVVSGTLASAAAAHHSFSMFNGQAYRTVNGVVSKFEWTNPHTFLEVQVPTRNGQTRYLFESSSPSLLKQQGWKRTSIRPGDRVMVGYYPLRDGRDGGMLVEVTYPEGAKLDAGVRGIVR